MAGPGQRPRSCRRCGTVGDTYCTAVVVLVVLVAPLPAVLVMEPVVDGWMDGWVDGAYGGVGLTPSLQNCITVSSLHISRLQSCQFDICSILVLDPPSAPVQEAMRAKYVAVSVWAVVLRVVQCVFVQVRKGLLFHRYQVVWLKSR